MVGAISVASDLHLNNIGITVDRIKDTKRAIEDKHAIGNLNMWGDAHR
jgi:hypothetical protein